MGKSEKTRVEITMGCVGCGLCHSVKGTELKADERGFVYPQFKEDDLAFYESVCPVFYYKENVEHDVWGTVEKALVAYSSDEEVRYMASSGGALTELAQYLLENDLADGILHTTYDPKDPTKTIPCISTTVEEIKSRCGSRYSISVPLEKICKMIDLTKKYAFIGKPCDVMALRRYCEKDKEMAAVFPYLLSFFCAGEPSVRAQQRLLGRMDCKPEECISLTYRGNGWPGYTTIIKQDGTTCELEYKKAWGDYLGRDLRDICRFCMDGTGDAADIVCADFWYLDDQGLPEFTEHDGRNIIIARTDRGMDLLNKAVEAKRLVCESDFTDHMDEFYRYQPNHYRRKAVMRSMIKAMKLCGRKTPCYNAVVLECFEKHASSAEKRQAFIGVIKRVIKGRL